MRRATATTEKGRDLIQRLHKPSLAVMTILGGHGGADRLPI
jgi:hypothetical protein